MNIITDRTRLRVPCEAVSFSEGNRIGQILVEELSNRPNAVGLAAPQIGINATVFAVKPEDGEIYYVINPVIHNQTEKALFDVEGCLSFPGETFKTVRHKEIEFSDDRISNKLTVSGFEAVVFQH